ncbi:MAG: hypothetical protein R3E97_16420 [Candidatus Eisenbacteria bacterium]
MTTQPKERPGAGDRFLANLAYLVPGYQGYKQKPTRQEEDARLRHRVLAHIAELHDLLANRHGTLLEVSLDRAADVLQQRIDRLDRLTQAVRYAPYGFAGFFDADEVTEEFLERLLELDLLLFQDFDETIEKVRGLAFPPSSRAGFDRFFLAVDAGIERIERRLVSRDKLLGNP